MNSPAVSSAVSPAIAVKVHANTRMIFDRLLADLQAHKETWATTPARERIVILDQVRRHVEEVAGGWVKSALAAKGIAADEGPAGEEWLNGPYLVARNLRLLRQSLVEISRSGRPRLPGRPYLHHGRVIAPVFPTGFFDWILFPGYRAEIWMQPHLQLHDLETTMATAYHDVEPTGGVALVLGAGNVSSIGPTDALYKLFVENRVVMLKLHPLTSYLRPHWERMFEPLIRRGFLQIVEGEVNEGTYLTRHPHVDEIHITGAAASHDAIVFGTGPDAEWRKSHGQPVVTKRISSELGNVSAAIVVPGRWTRRDLQWQAENLVSSVVNNAGFNCNATRVIVTHRAWPQREAFLAALRETFAQVPLRDAYYPGARERYERFLHAHPQAELFGSAERGGKLPWVLICDLDPSAKDDICFRSEAFCGLVGETAIAGHDPAEFVRRAVEFVNTTVQGTLNATVIVHPRSLRDSAVSGAVDEAIRDLRAGTVAVNHWAAVGYAMGCTTWGAFPGQHLVDVGSGLGVVHNTYMFAYPEKSVVRGPFRPWPKPPWFWSHRRARELGPKLVEFESRPSVLKLPSIFRLACEF